MNNSIPIWVEGLVNSMIVFVVILPVGILWFWVDPVNRGFYCNDESLSYPLRDNTISNAALCLVCIGLPISIIIATEWFNPDSMAPREKIKKICFTIIDHLFGVAVTVLLTIVAIYSIGRLR